MAAAPQIAKTIDARLVDVIFNETVDPISAVIPGNYAISPTLAVVAVALTSPNSVRLTTARQVNGTTYTLTVSGVGP